MNIKLFRLTLALALVVPIMGANLISNRVVSAEEPVTPPVEEPTPTPTPTPVPVTPPVEEPTPTPVPVTPPAPGQDPAPQQSNNSNNSNNNNNNSSQSTSSSNSSSSCGATAPTGKMELFQINRSGTTAVLYFTPNASAQSYHVIFGHKEGDERYGGISMTPISSNGVQSITINHLAPRQTYSFRVIPVNGCAAGTSSNWLTAAGKANKFISYLYGKKN